MKQTYIDVVYHPLSPLVIVSFLWAVINVLYLCLGMSPSAKFEMVASASWAFLLIYWMVADARHRKSTPCFDFGFLCYVLFPLTVLWYCFWSRGWKGMLTLLGLMALLFLPYIAGAVAWKVLYG